MHPWREQAYKDHPNFSKNRLATTMEFTVHHYAGMVTYNASGFVEKNRDQLQVRIIRTIPCLFVYLRYKFPVRDVVPCGKDSQEKRDK